jgi:hypothetical protein
MLTRLSIIIFTIVHSKVFAFTKRTFTAIYLYTFDYCNYYTLIVENSKFFTRHFTVIYTYNNIYNINFTPVHLFTLQ